MYYIMRDGWRRNHEMAYVGFDVTQGPSVDGFVREASESAISLRICQT